MANLLGQHRKVATLVTREIDQVKVIRMELSSEELDRGIELEQHIVSQLVRNHVW